MKRWQTLVLLVLGLLDLAVIGLLGVTVRRAQQPPPPLELSFAPCADLALENLPGQLSPTAHWTSHRLDLRLTAWYDVPAPPESSGQLLWTALDALPAAFDTGCPPPAEVVMVITAHGTLTTQGHIATFDGQDVAAWSEGRLDEEVLVERGNYRLSAPPATQPALTPSPP